jgi:hypothetical protein
MVDQHVEGRRLDRHHVGDRPDRGRGPQHADDLRCRLRIDQIAALGRDLGVERLALDAERAEALVVAGAQVGGEGLLVRRLVVDGPLERRTRGSDGLAVEHGELAFLFLELRLDLGLKGLELAEEAGERVLHLERRGLRPRLGVRCRHLGSRPVSSIPCPPARHASISLASRKASASSRASASASRH